MAIREPVTSDSPQTEVVIAEGRWRAFRKFLVEDKSAATGLILLLAIVLLAILVPELSSDSASRPNIGDRHIPPVWSDGGSWSHVVGTDALGRDVLLRTLAAARVSLLVGVSVVLISGVFGTVVGLVAGYRGGWIDSVSMRFADAQIAFPGILLVAMVIALVGPSITVVIVVLAIYGWMIYARLVRSSVLHLRKTGYIVAAELVGSGTGRIMRRHLVPSIMAPVLTQAMLELARIVLAEASLSYLGLGIQPPDASWGLMVAENQQYLREAGWSVIVPGLALAVTVLSVNLVATSLRSRIDPRQSDRVRALRAAKKRAGG